MARDLNDASILKGYWRLNGNTDDYSGNGNHGIWNGTEAYGINLFGKQCANLDGSSYIAVNEISSTQFTLCAWVKISSGKEQTIVGADDVNSYIAIDAFNDIVLKNGTFTQFDIDPNIRDDAFDYLVLCSDGTNLYAYLNGESAGSIAYSDGMKFTNIGKNGDRWYYEDLLSEVRYYNVCLTADEIKELYYMPYPYQVEPKQVSSNPGLGEIVAPDDSLELHLMNGDRDLSKNDVAVVNNGCILGDGIESKGVDESFDTDFNPSNKITNDYTVNVWFKVLSDSTGYIYSADDGPGDSFYLSYNSGGSITAGISSLDAVVDNNTLLNRYYMYTLIQEGNTAKVYVNGNIVNTSNITVDLTTRSKINLLADDTFSSGFLNAKIKEFRLYSEAKDQAWITEQYNRTKIFY